MSVISSEPMAKKTAADETSPSAPTDKTDQVNLKADASLKRKAKMVAAARGISLVEYIDSLIRLPIERDHEAVVGRGAK